MLSPELHYLVSQEQHKDRLRDLEHQQLLQAAGLQAGVNFKPHRQAAGWLGSQMVKWGSKLQSYGATPPSNRMTVET